jgi:5-methylcytosine-specific restriction endonuclease McrA
VCGTTNVSLQVHHITYARLGNELPSDLLVVCFDCHRRKDGERDRETQRKREEARTNRAFNTWCEKRGMEDSEYEWDLFVEWITEKQSDDF